MNDRTRDVVAFFLGFAGMVHQTVVAPQPQWILVLAFFAMMIGPKAMSTLLDRWGR